MIKKSTRRDFLKKMGLGAGSLALAGGARAATPAAKPNIIMIMADDIGFECYSCYGSEYYKTPNIDKLAATGARFDHAYSQPLCTPSRVKIMTGKYNFRNYTVFGELDLEQKTFAHVLKEADYRTCAAGKWQLSPGDLKGPYTAGFDEYCLWHFQGGELPGKGSRYASPLIYRDSEPMADLEDKYGPDIASDYVCDFMSRNTDNPFLVYYPMILVHNPFDPTPDSVDWGEKNSKREPLERFRDMVAYMDKIVGKITDKLEELGLRENTLIVVTGDNGTNRSITSPFPIRGEIAGGKGTMPDAGTHVAFVANFPGRIAPGTVVDSPIHFADVLPTMAGLAGAPVPADVDGQSFWPLTQGDTSNARGWAFVSYSAQGPVKGDDFRYFVRDQRWKLYATGELYDVPKDWKEKNPLTSPETAPVRERLQAILDKILKDAPPPTNL